MNKIYAISLIILFTSCTGTQTKKDVFIGEWVMSKSSPTFDNKTKDMTIKITKDDIFYKVEFFIEGKNMISEMEKLAKNETDKLIAESFRKYQLSPDKRFLFCVVAPTEPTFYIMYNDDNNTISNTNGWFIKK